MNTSRSNPPAPTAPLPPPKDPIPLTLHIYQNGLSHRSLTITSSDKQTPLYTTSKPFLQSTIEIFRPGSQPIGTIHFPFFTFSRTIHLTINHQPYTLSPAGGIFSRSMHFPSNYNSIGILKWVCEGARDMVCVNAEKEWVAKFEGRMWSVGKVGTLVCVNRDFPEGLRDELVVSGLAMVEKELRRRAGGAGS